ncbi:MAG: TonB-dependent receptor [Bryobacteraceae bacterium]
MRWPAILLLTPLLLGQTTALLSGLVVDPTGAAVPGAGIELSQAAHRFQVQATSGAAGEFRFANLPLQTYRLAVRANGFGPFEQVVELRSNIPVSLTVTLRLEAVREAAEVNSESHAAQVDPQQTSTYAQLNRSDMERLPGAGRGLESVLVTLPGFAQNANGAIHPRGAHNQMTYVVDGMPIGDQLTGAFANAIDPNIVQTVELFTGNIPAEYGNKVSAVVNVTTRSGLGSGRAFGGGFETGAGSFDTLSEIAHVSGQRGAFGYSASANLFKSNRYLDAVSRDNLHNGGNSERGFVRLDWQASSRDSLRWTLLAGNANFELANLRSQHASGMDQRQRLLDFAALMGWVRVLDARTTVDSTASIRPASAQLLPSRGDTPVTAWQSRRLATYNFSTSLNHVRGRHQLRTGGAWQRFPVREQFRFAIADPRFNDPRERYLRGNVGRVRICRGGAPA